jgi:GNAT superfamily N-acetyltransferase
VTGQFRSVSSTQRPRLKLQNLGLGAEIIEGLIDLAASRERAVALDVFDVNPARHLYERLGFEPIGVSGRKVHMWRAHS